PRRTPADSPAAPPAPRARRAAGPRRVPRPTRRCAVSRARIRTRSNGTWPESTAARTRRPPELLLLGRAPGVLHRLVEVRLELLALLVQRGDHVVQGLLLQ